MLVPSRYCETINIGIRLDAFETTSFPWMLSVIANPIVLQILFSLYLGFYFWYTYNSHIIYDFNSELTTSVVVAATMSYNLWFNYVF